MKLTFKLLTITFTLATALNCFGMMRVFSRVPAMRSIAASYAAVRSPLSKYMPRASGLWVGNKATSSFLSPKSPVSNSRAISTTSQRFNGYKAHGSSSHKELSQFSRARMTLAGVMGATAAGLGLYEKAKAESTKGDDERRELSKELAAIARFCAVEPSNNPFEKYLNEKKDARINQLRKIIDTIEKEQKFQQAIESYLLNATADKNLHAIMAASLDLSRNRTESLYKEKEDIESQLEFIKFKLGENSCFDKTTFDQFEQFVRLSSRK